MEREIIKNNGKEYVINDPKLETIYKIEFIEDGQILRVFKKANKKPTQYSVNDTIIVFDRIRENLPNSREDFENTVNRSVNQTLSRSINTSASSILVLLAIIFLGGATIKDFALALAIGIFIGTYSSIFVASPVLVIWDNLVRRARKS